MARIESRFSGTISASAMRRPNSPSRNETSSSTPVESISPASISDSPSPIAARSSRKRKFSSMNLRTLRSVSWRMTPPSGDRGCNGGTGSGSDELAMPKLGRQDADEGRVVAEADEFPVTALGDESLDRAGIEEAGAGKIGRGQAARHVIRRIRADEGGGVWRAVRLLGAVRDRVRQQPLGGFAQDVLLAQAAELDLRRNARAQFDDAVIEEREAALDCMCHRHAVALRGEDVAREQIDGFEILRLRQGMPAHEVGREAFAQ